MKDKIILNMSELMEYLGVSLNHARTLMHRKDFPTYQIGQSLFTTKPAVDRWLLLGQDEPKSDIIEPSQLKEVL